MYQHNCYHLLLNIIVHVNFFLQLCLSKGEVQVVLPLVYDVATNITQLAEKRDPASQYPPASLQHQASNILKRFVLYVC